MARTRSGPSTVGLVFSSLFALLLGFFVGYINLAMKPAQVVREIPDEEERVDNTNYLVLGGQGGGGSYRGKERMMAGETAGTYTLNERELNTWARASLASRPVQPNEGGPSFVQFEPPNFRIGEGELTVMVPIVFNVGEEGRTTYFEATGVFENEAGGVAFVPREVYLGSARTPTPILAPLLREIVMLQYREREAYEGLQEIWRNVEAVDIEDNELVLRYLP